MKNEVKFKYRTAIDSDFDSVVECIRDVYGDCYVDKNIFNANYLRSINNTDKLTMYVATTEEGEIAGTLALCKPIYFTRVMLLYIFTIKKKFQGNHLSDQMHYEAIKSMKSKNYNCIYAQAVTRHNISQNIAEKNGFIPTGFLFSLYDKEYSEEIKKIKTEIQTLVIYTLDLENKKKTNIYVDESIKTATMKCYDKFKMEYTLQTQQGIDETIEDETKIAFYNDDNCKRLYMQITKCGKDLSEKVLEMERLYSEEPMQTRNVYLNINDFSAIYGYKELKKLGYKFAGFKPLSDDYEYMVMFDGKNIEYDFSGINLTMKSKELFEEVAYEIEK